MEGSMLQVMIGSLWLRQTLSGHIQLDVVVSYVGMSAGSTIIMLCSVIRSRSGFIISAEFYCHWAPIEGGDG